METFFRFCYNNLSGCCFFTSYLRSVLPEAEESVTFFEMRFNSLPDLQNINDISELQEDKCYDIQD